MFFDEEAKGDDFKCCLKCLLNRICCFLGWGQWGMIDIIGIKRCKPIDKALKTKWISVLHPKSKDTHTMGNFKATQIHTMNPLSSKLFSSFNNNIIKIN